MKRIAFVCIAAMLILWPGAIVGQQQQGQMKGRVADTAGRPVTNLTIVVRNTTTGTEHEGTTDGRGEFLIVQLEPGTYSVQSRRGQPAANPQQAQVDAARTTDVSIRQTGSGELEVLAEVLAVNSTSPARNVYSPSQVEFNPEPNAITRSGDYFGAYNLSLLGEAVTPGNIGQTGVGPSVAGRPNTSNNFVVNGIDNNDQSIPGPLVSISNEASTEFVLEQSQQLVQIGNSTGGYLNTALYSAGNQWHGGVYDYLNNRNLNASEAALRSDRDLRYDQNRMGGKIGGPLIRDTLFTFLNFEYIPLRTERVSLNPVLAPTTAGFRALALTSGISLINLNALRNSVRISETPLRTININGTIVPLGLVNNEIRTDQDQYQGMARLDWAVSAQSTLAARYVQNQIGMDVFNSSLPAFSVPGNRKAILGALSYTTAISTNLTGSLNFGYNRLDRNAGGGSFTFPGQTAFPNINIQDVGLSLGPNVVDGKARGNTYQFATTWDWTGSVHRFRFGVDWRDMISTFSNSSLDAGYYAYSDLGRFLLDLPPDVAAQRAFGGAEFNANRNLVYAFVQDSLQLGGVDVDLGLGYQYAQAPRSIRRQSLFSDLNRPGLITFDEPKIDNWNFAPHLGLAWAPPGSQTVIRGSFGMAYDALYGTTSLLAPDTVVGTVTTAALNTPGFLAAGGVRRPITRAAGIGRISNQTELPYVVNWTGSASHAFWGTLMTEFKYTGHHGVHLPIASLLNGTTRVSATNSLPVFLTVPDRATLNALRITQDGLASRGDAFTAAGFINPILTTREEGTSWYNAASVRIAEVFTAGTQFSAQYTYSDNRIEGTGTLRDLSFGRRSEQAPWNRKHRGTVTTLIDIGSVLPTGGWLQTIFLDMSLTGTFQYASAQRVALFSGLDTGMDGGLGSGLFVNPLGIPGTSTGVTPLTNDFGQTVAFVATDPNARFIAGGVGTFSTDRPTVEFDDTRNVDLALVKRFSIKDAAKLEFRGDGYNIFNRAQFTGLPITTLGRGIGPVSPSFLLAGNPQFNNIRGSLSSNPRTFQLAMRLIF